MGETYQIKSTPEQATDREIYEAGAYRGYIANNELHLISKNAYYVYKFLNGRWYMRNDIKGTDHYLGVGASPTLLLDSIDIKDSEYWSGLMVEAQDIEK